MRALGYNVPLHRTLAFGVGAFIAAVSGILSVWWNTRISPGSISLGQTIDVLVIAVVGGLFRLEGAWVGAILFAVLDNETRGVQLIGERFNTVIGVVFLVIVLVSPGGIMGIWQSVLDFVQRRVGGESRIAPEQAGAGFPLADEPHPAAETPPPR
jgi:branched-chain amino acid transport system permease protein